MAKFRVRKDVGQKVRVRYGKGERWGKKKR